MKGSIEMGGGWMSDFYAGPRLDGPTRAMRYADRVLAGEILAG